MAIPSSYDRNGFAEYIHFEVLQYVAEQMEWFCERGADVPQTATPQAITLNGDTVDNSPTITVDALPTAIYASNPITFTDGGGTHSYTAAEDYDAGETILKVFPYVTSIILDNTVGSYSPIPHPRDTHPVYSSILDEVLIQMGLTDVSQVNADTIHKLRLYGKIEAWRSIMCNVAGTPSQETTEGIYFNRGSVFFDARDQMAAAISEASRIFDTVPNQVGAYNTSGITKVVGRW